jgi:hypothetical protein
MNLRLPLVLVNGRINELPANDVLAVVVASASYSVTASYASSSLNISASYALTSSYSIDSGVIVKSPDEPADLFEGLLWWDTDDVTVNSIFESASYALTASYALNGGSGGGTKTIQSFRANDNQPISGSTYAVWDTRNSRTVISFIDSAYRDAIFPSVIPDGADLSSGVEVLFGWTGTTATGSNVIWGCRWEAEVTDCDSDSYDSASVITSSANSTSGIPIIGRITTTYLDGLAPLTGSRLLIYRDGAALADTMVGGAEIHWVIVNQIA